MEKYLFAEPVCRQDFSTCVALPLRVPDMGTQCAINHQNSRGSWCRSALGEISANAIRSSKMNRNRD